MAKVVLTEPAEFDLQDIDHYISVNLCSPQAAKRITEGIINVIKNLEYNPKRQPIINNSYLRRMQLRRIGFANYNIFYYYDSGYDIVFIFRILYNQSDWQSILKM